MIEGGWSFVWSAYAITWLSLLGYGIYLFFQSTDPHDKTESES